MMTVFSMAFLIAGLFTIRSGLMSDAWTALTVRRGSAQEALVKRTSHSFPLSVNLSSSSSRNSSVFQSPPLTSSCSWIHSEGQVMLCLWRSLFPVLFIWCIMYKGPDVCFTPSLALLNNFPAYLCFSILTQGLIRWDWRWAFKTSSLLLGLQVFLPCVPLWKPGHAHCCVRPEVWESAVT